MKKRFLALTMAMTMVAGSLVACGETPAAPAGDSTTPTTTDGQTTTVTDDFQYSSIMNIYCWNDEFQNRVKDHYADYEEIDATTGKIGDVKVVWTITPSEGNAYQNKLDDDLSAGKTGDEAIDMFLIEADYALKYVNTDYTMAIADLGITEDDLKDQFQYTKDVVTDSNGVLKGLSWQGCPCVMFYNRDIATAVLGTDDADAVQAAVKDWATFDETAATMKEAGFQMVATTNDAYRVYSNNVSTPWVVDNKIVVDDNIKAWAEASKVYAENGYASTDALWSDAWNNGMKDAVITDDGKAADDNQAAFAYFGPAWLINFCMHAGDAGYAANSGKWGAVVGPQSSFWGGTWICAAAGTDNADIIKDIMLKLTCDADVMTEIVKADDDFVNNAPAMEAMAKDASYSSAVLGGINPLQLYVDGVKTIDLSNLSAYDQTCNEEFQNAMKNWFDGNYESYDAALEVFYKAVEEKHPELSH